MERRMKVSGLQKGRCYRILPQLGNENFILLQVDDENYETVQEIRLPGFSYISARKAVVIEGDHITYKQSVVISLFKECEAEEAPASLMEEAVREYKAARDIQLHIIGRGFHVPEITIAKG